MNSDLKTMQVFSRFFKRLSGISPTEFRLKIRREFGSGLGLKNIAIKNMDLFKETKILNSRVKSILMGFDLIIVRT